jgi:hypothetical protein
MTGVFRLPLVLLIACAACVPPAGRVHPEPAIEEADRLSSAVKSASLRMTAAIDAAQPQVIAKLLTADVELVTLHRDVVQGRERVANVLASLALAPGKGLRVFSGAVCVCRDGTVQEYGGAFTGPPLFEGGAAAFSQGAVLIEWEVTGDAPVIRRMDLAVGLDANRRPTCERVHLAAAVQQRFTVTAAAEAGQRAPSPVITAVQQRLGALGFDYGKDPLVESRRGGFTGAVRYRFHPRFSTELQATVRRREQSEGWNRSLSRRVVVISRPVALTQLVQVQWRGLRAGAGPSYLLHNLDVQDRYERYEYRPPDMVRIDGDTIRARSRAGAFGVAAQVGASVPLGRRGVLEFLVGDARYAKARVPATQNFTPAGESARSLPTAAVALGWGW